MAVESTMMTTKKSRATSLMVEMRRRFRRRTRIVNSLGEGGGGVKGGGVGCVCVCVGGVDD